MIPRPWHPDCRPWQYNSDVDEFYVITEDHTKLKKSDTTREREETALADL
jgi:hypothetical protein